MVGADSFCPLGSSWVLFVLDAVGALAFLQLLFFTQMCLELTPAWV